MKAVMASNANRPAAFPAAPADERARLAMAVASAPRDPAPRRALAAALAKAGEHKAALDQYRALLALMPTDPDTAANAGLMARKCNCEEEVLPTVRSAAAANPNHARLWQVLGLMHRGLDELDSAIEALGRAAGLAPGDPLVQHGLARATLEGGSLASPLFERAARLAPADESIRLGLVAALVAEGRWKDAAALLDTQLRQSPGWIAGHGTLSRLLWAMGERERFVDSLERALLTNPRDAGLWRELILNLTEARRFDSALEAVARGREALGPLSLFAVNEAIVLDELGRTEEAGRLFSALRPIEEPTLAVRFVRHLLRTGRIEEAAAAAEAWLSHPAANFFWPYMAIAWRLLGDSRWEWLEGQNGLVGIYDLGSAIPSLDELADRLRGLHNFIGQPLEQSVRGGTQTDGTLFSRTEPEIRALRAAIVDAVRTHIAGLPPPDPRHPQLACPRAPIRFSGSWSVRLTGAGHHANHIHPAGWFSSAFYVVVPDESERGGGEAGWLTLGEPQAELGLDLAPFRTIEPKPGRLALFPSTMWHGTRPIAGGERMTVAFDVALPR